MPHKAPPQFFPPNFFLFIYAKRVSTPQSLFHLDSNNDSLSIVQMVKIAKDPNYIERKKWLKTLDYKLVTHIFVYYIVTILLITRIKKALGDRGQNF